MEAAQERAAAAPPSEEEEEEDDDDEEHEEGDEPPAKAQRVERDYTTNDVKAALRRYLASQKLNATATSASTVAQETRIPERTVRDPRPRAATAVRTLGVRRPPRLAARASG